MPRPGRKVFGGMRVAASRIAIGEGSDMSDTNQTAEKATLSYRVVAGKNPQDPKDTVLRPLIVNKETYNTARCLKYAMKNGYVIAGQYYSNYGIIHGFLEAVQSLGLEGRDILLNNWIRIHPELKGRINPETRQLSGDNDLRVCVRALKELRRKADEFSWSNVDEPETVVKIDRIYVFGGDATGIMKTKGFAANGRNLLFDASSGDTAQLTWETEEGSGAVPLTPSSSSAYNIVFDWPKELDGVEAGTVLTFTLTRHLGGKDAAPQVVKRRVTLLENA